MKGEADFNYNQINVIVSGKLDKIFYELLFSELLKSDVHVKNEDGNFRAKQLLKIGESYSNLDVDPKGKDKEVLDECFNYSESDFVIGIIDYDDGINYYLDNPSYKLKKDLPMHIAYTDGADIESMVNYYQPNLLMQALKSRYDMPNEKEIQECIDKTIKNSAKLRMIRLTENGLIKVDDNESKYFLPNNPTFIMEKRMSITFISII